LDRENLEMFEVTPMGLHAANLGGLPAKVENSDIRDFPVQPTDWPHIRTNQKRRRGTIAGISIWLY
jgi:hypothetical protein